MLFEKRAEKNFLRSSHHIGLDWIGTGQGAARLCGWEGNQVWRKVMAAYHRVNDL